MPNKRKPRPDDFSIHFLEGKKVRKIEAGHFCWKITFVGHPDFTISVTQRAIYDEHGNVFREDR